VSKVRPERKDAIGSCAPRRRWTRRHVLVAPTLTLTILVAAPPAAAADPSASTRPTANAAKSAGKAAKATKKAKVNPNTPVELFAINGKETLQLRLRDDKGRPMRNVQKRFDRFLRCHHTNKVHAMNPRLVRVLYQVGKHYPGRRLEVVSGYRHPSVAKNPRSPHMKGLACDFRVVGIKNTELRDYLRTGFQKVGVGYYPNSSFVHLDMRKDRSAFWIDYSGPGERAIYAENAQADVRNGRADTYKPTKIDSSWATEDEGGGDDGTDEASTPPPPIPGGAPVDDVNKGVAGAVESPK
jgi:uncharacterized protein YcbK (DUF882 family)